MPLRLPIPRAPPLLPLLASSLFLSGSAARAAPAPPADPSRRPPASSASNILSIDSRHGGGGGSSSQGGPKGTGSGGQVASRLIDRYKRRVEEAGRSRQAQLELMHKHKDSHDYLRQMPRRFEPGDVYSPHDLSPAEMQKWRRRSRRTSDVVDLLGIRPLDLYKNFSLVQDFTTSSGQIMRSSDTGLRLVNQRKMAKMIRRLQGMGIYPTIHDHPEMLRFDFFPSGQRNK